MNDMSQAVKLGMKCMHEGQQGTTESDTLPSSMSETTAHTLSQEEACMQQTHRIALWIKQHALRFIPKPDYLQHISNSAIKRSPASHDQGVRLKACNVAQHRLSLGTQGLTHEQGTSRLHLHVLNTMCWLDRLFDLQAMPAWLTIELHNEDTEISSSKSKHAAIAVPGLFDPV